MRKSFYGLLAVAFLIFCLGIVHGAPVPGTLKWAYLTEGGIYSSPAIGPEGTIYVGSGDFRLYAINPDGTQKWSYATGDAIDSSPAIGRDGTIYVGSGDFRLYAINPDGTLRWSYATGDRIRSSPAIGADGTIYVGSGDYKLHAVNANGSFKWSYATGRGIYSSPAIGRDGTIYVGSLGNEFYAINPDGTLRWSYDTGGRISSSPAIAADGTIYVGSGDNSFYFFSRNGVVEGRLETTANFGSPPAIGRDGTIYVGSSDGVLHAIDPATKHGASFFGTGGEVYSSPAIAADGTIYVGSLDCNLYAISSSSLGPAVSPWPMFRHDLKHTGSLAPLLTPSNLTVIKSGSGAGAVTSLPSGIDCGAICSAGYTKNTRVTLTPVPESGSIFTGWSGACKGRGVCAVTMTADKSVEAIFDKGSCTYAVSPKGKSFAYTGGAVTIGITATGSSYCPAPDISQEGEWFALGSIFFKNKGTARLTVPEYDSSTPRTSTVTIGENIFLVTQKGKPCALSLSASSGLFLKEGGTGLFTVTAKPADCTWTATSTGTFAWITILSGESGTGTGDVAYTVDANPGPSARNGSIKIVTFDKKNKSYTVKQSK